MTNQRDLADQLLAVRDQLLKVHEEVEGALRAEREICRPIGVAAIAAAEGLLQSSSFAQVDGNRLTLVAGRPTKV